MFILALFEEWCAFDGDFIDVAWCSLYFLGVETGGGVHAVVL